MSREISGMNLTSEVSLMHSAIVAKNSAAQTLQIY